MLKAGVDLDRDVKELRFSGFPVDRVAFAVQDGTVDAGVLRACLLEELAAEGRVDPARFRVLAPKTMPGFDCAVSTDLYPDWPLARLASTPQDLAKAVVVALFEMPADHPAAKAAGYEGWTVPLDYQSVHTLFRSLRIGPYRHLREVSLVDIAREHWEWLAVGALALLWWAIHSLRVGHLIKVRTAELRAANRDLVHEMAERRRAQENAQWGRPRSRLLRVKRRPAGQRLRAHHRCARAAIQRTAGRWWLMCASASAARPARSPASWRTTSRRTASAPSSRPTR